jgi:hypothetical protein
VLRRLEDRIRVLCAKAVAIPDSAEASKVLQELRQAIHEHIQRLRKHPAQLQRRGSRQQ